MLRTIMQWGGVGRRLPLCLLAVGCYAAQSTMDVRPQVRQENGPTEISNSGVVSYYMFSTGWRTKSGRPGAYKKMHKACGGLYKIDSEGPINDYWYIHFTCVKP
jgi:hypothetical protein